VSDELEPIVKIHQCLFGYSDGHRLLASSLRLPDTMSNLLLPLSDSAPGLRLTDTDSYWTGLPLGPSRYYGLMRTWSAPEMSRPGCVWSHVLLVRFADIPRFVDLSILALEAKRPRVAEHFDSYTTVLLVKPGTEEAEHAARAFALPDALHIVKALYEPQVPSVISGPIGAFEEAIFAAWSQQWPRLRRTFAFRTATGTRETIASISKFDLLVSVSPDRATSHELDDLSSAAPWVQAAVDDMRWILPSQFRRFLWRYGSDIRRGRDRFRFLAELYLSTRTPSLSDGQLANTLLSVSQGLPSPDDGRVLKEDLVSCGRNPFSLLPPGDPLSTIQYFVSNHEAEILPPPPLDVFACVSDLWPNRSKEILSIAEQAAAKTSRLGNLLLDSLATVVEPAAFLEATAQLPHLRARLLEANPLLLDSEYLLHIPQPELSQLAALIPENCVDLAERVVRRLLPLNDVMLASELLQRFPTVVAKATIDAIELREENPRFALGVSWLRNLPSRSSEILRGGFVQSARSTTTLLTLAEILGLDSAEILRVGPLPWAEGLRGARDNVKGEARQVFLAFLLAVSLAHPTAGCEPLLELAFEPIHTDLARSRLSYDASALLIRHLPEVAWWRQWDACHRLRLGVVTAYVVAGLNPRSFECLTSDASTFSQIVTLAKETKRGQGFLRSVSGRGRTRDLST
jgi:hypothetical protein